MEGIADSRLVSRREVEEDEVRRGDKLFQALTNRGDFLTLHEKVNRERGRKPRIIKLDAYDISDNVDFAALENDIHLGRMIGATHNLC